MAAPPAQKPDHDGSTAAAGRSNSERTRNAGMVVLAVLVTLFAVFNLNDVKVNWVFGSGHAPLIVVIVVSVLVGILLTYMAERVNRRRRQQPRPR
jgi:uncharacterized integral membrane protein